MFQDSTQKRSKHHNFSSPSKGYTLSMWHVALRDALKAERSARYRAFLSPISCWPRGIAPGPTLLKELAVLTLSSKLDKWNVIQLWRRPKEARRHTTLKHATKDDTDELRHKMDVNTTQTCYTHTQHKTMWQATKRTGWQKNGLIYFLKDTQQM